MEQGYLAFVLHAHLPYVRHPEHEDFLEERWFYEAMTETYIPLLAVFERLVNDNIDFRLTMSLTPPLLSMMSDQLLQDRYGHHLYKLIELSFREIERTKDHHQFNATAHMYNHRLQHIRWMFEDQYNRNIVNGFRKFMEMGKLEIITCGATHGFLPLMRVSPEAVRAQIQVACNTHQKYLGKRPRGIWLPECGYFPGLEEELWKAGIKFFFLDTHGIILGDTPPKYGVYAPVYTPTGCAAFGRDQESSTQVWSAKQGYPGHPYYRDFYRDIGFDLDYEYIKPYIHKDGIRLMTGLKYHRVTGEGDHKEPYEPQRAEETAAEHAGNFMFNRQQQIKHLHGIMKRKPLVVAPYDAELYGHWWYEGVRWLEIVIRKIACDQNEIKLTTPWEYLNHNPKNQVIQPSESSWGNKGYAEVWCNGTNDWIYRHLHEASFRMTELAKTYADPDDNLRRALNQMARELLLAQASDWAFIMNSGTMTEYAVKRTKDHQYRFNRLYWDIKNYSLDMNFVAETEWKDNIFPEIDYKVYT